MRIEQLLYLKDLHETNSITQTSQRFFMTQQGISNAIRSLEEEFHSVFLSRTNHGVTLTKDGIRFLSYADRIIEDYKTLNANFHLSDDDAEVYADRVSIACHPRLMSPFLIDIIETVHNQYPFIQLDVVEKKKSSITDQVLEDNIDIGLSVISQQITSSKTTENEEQLLKNRIAFHGLYMDSCVCVCKQNHILAQKNSINFQDLKDHPIIFFGNQHQDKSVYVPGNNVNAISNTSTYCTTDISFHKAMIKQGLAVSLISSFEFRKLYRKHPYLTAVSVDEPFRFHFFMATKRDYSYSPSALKVIELIKQYNFHDD